MAYASVPSARLTTLITVTISVATLYVALFVLNLDVAWFLVPQEYLETTLIHKAALGTYMSLA
ncbi:hypothetical protein ACFQS2_10940 [Brachybacterium sp. GCM10030267]|uniref:hypothetical protein n=1 Tax=unclassified Brachybacterium TaxID=2623841 RepID=UPI0036067E05